jgi:hypothetical protein
MPTLSTPAPFWPSSAFIFKGVSAEFSAFAASNSLTAHWGSLTITMALSKLKISMNVLTASMVQAGAPLLAFHQE